MPSNKHQNYKKYYNNKNYYNRLPNNNINTTVNLTAERSSLNLRRLKANIKYRKLHTVLMNRREQHAYYSSMQRRYSSEYGRMDPSQN